MAQQYSQFPPERQKLRSVLHVFMLACFCRKTSLVMRLWCGAMFINRVNILEWVQVVINSAIQYVRIDGYDAIRSSVDNDKGKRRIFLRQAKYYINKNKYITTYVTNHSFTQHKIFIYQSMDICNTTKSKIDRLSLLHQFTFY